MNFREYTVAINRITELAKRKSTGSPKELAKRLNVSERTTFRLIESIKEQGTPIIYCRHSSSYIIKV